MVKKPSQLLVVAMMVIAALMLVTGQAMAGAGAGLSYDLAENPMTVPTYYANSPAGTWIDWQGNSHDSGTALEKFVDPLPGLCKNVTPSTCSGQYIPIAIPDTTTYPGSDYYEIGVVEYSQKMHRDLPKASKLRGYVQLQTANTIASSRQILLKYPGGANIKDINNNDVYALDNPTYLGPVIIASKGTPVRIKYLNLLPVGNSGDLFIPVDKTLMGAGTGPDNTTYYTENRIAIHHHGGDTPWISDGTPSQWTTPVGETATYKTGDSFQIVPDMTDPGKGHGAGTLYFTNDISGRLMFYHDHAMGTTRLNVYAGMAAGFLQTDASERALVSANTPEIPLVIQDKTFVPNDILTQDSKWNTTHWGSYGDLWYPNVYEFNQDPNSFDFTNPVGRWDYGPYFWPIFPVAPGYVIPDGTWDTVNNRSNATTTPEAFNDTPIINGIAYPTLTVEPKAYRFRILNAANDRFFNLGLYVAAKAVDCTVSGGTGYTVGTVVKFTGGLDPAIPNAQAAAGTVTAVNAGAITGFAMTGFGTYASLPTGITSQVGSGATFSCTLSKQTEMAMVPFDSTSNFPTTGGLLGTGWGTPVADLFPMGVPSPATIGPDIIQIGNEGGLLPAAVTIPSTPVNYEYNKRSVTVLNIMEHGLLLGNAERADVIVDFSAFAGKTLMLYNDAPAPVPAGDPRIDYYTGNPDFTDSGGAATTHPGYGPNTRTLMQIVVGSTVNGASPVPNLANVSTAYAATQPKPVVAELAYNAAFGAPNTANKYAQIRTGSMYFPSFDFIAGDTISYYPFNYPLPALPALPTLASTRTTVAAGSLAQVPVQNKAIQELFDDWGRMNATLGVELPFTNGMNQTTVPLNYIDPATETIEDGETQIWKITHNGVDTHPVHFHLVNVQLINRVGWDGTIKTPDANEVGWKETVRMNPLEDVIVAVRANAPKLPFGVPTSSRMLSPAEPPGSTMGFSNLDPATGNAFNPPIFNQMADFGWEYVWHCHILGHEENDFMRPFIFKFPAELPNAPTGLGATLIGANQINLAWTDPTPINWSDPTHSTFGSFKNEIGFRIERSVNGGAYAPLPVKPLANATTYSDTSVTGGTMYAYRVVAFNAKGDSAASNIANIGTPGITITAPATGSNYTSPATINITTSTAATITRVEFYKNGTTLLGTVNAAPFNFSWTNVPNGTYSISVKAYDALSQLYTTAPVTVNVSTVRLINPNGGEELYSGQSYTINWTAATNATQYQLRYRLNNGAWQLINPSAPNLPGTSYVWTVPTVGARTTGYQVMVTAFNGTTQLGFDVSDATFAINPPAVTITSPASGTYFGTLKTVSFTTSVAPIITSVDFYNGATLLGTASSAPFSFDWTSVPNGTYTITAKGHDALGNLYASAPVTVRVATVHVTNPNGGETLTSGTPYTINWTGTASATLFQIRYRLNTGAWQLVNGNIPGTSTSYSWTVPTVGAPTTGYQIMVTAYNGTTQLGFDTSDATFTISP